MAFVDACWKLLRLEVDYFRHHLQSIRRRDLALPRRLRRESRRSASIAYLLKLKHHCFIGEQLFPATPVCVFLNEDYHRR